LAIYAKKPRTEYVNPDPGRYIAVLADIEEGTAKGYQPEDPDRDVVTFHWLLDELNPKTGKPFEVQRRFNLTLFAGKNGSAGSPLYQMCKSWLGANLSQAEADALDLEVFLGQSCEIQIIHHETADGKVFANVQTVLPLSKTQAAIQVPEGYQRRKDRT
jgi:hypothetical protein